MSGIHYASRPYRAGDEDGINALYCKVTGRLRTQEQWSWQWREAPGGHGDVWLVEATHPDGRVELIGHHGIMPIRFTWGKRDLLFGKTENTMVLPEYRAKILYPRFEKRFAQAYEPRYHALFSTMGPAAAIRQRKAMGYTIKERWVELEDSREPWGTLVRLAQHPRLGFLGVAAAFASNASSSRDSLHGATLLSADECRREPFFEHYWERAREHWGIAPDRSAADLSWRYWNNPYLQYFAVIVRMIDGDDALVICCCHPGGFVDIVDFSARKPDPELLSRAIHLAINAIRARYKRSLLRLHLTEDAIPAETFTLLTKELRLSLIRKIRCRSYATAMGSFMPRKITARGSAISLPISPWNVTFAVSEGRSE